MKCPVCGKETQEIVYTNKIWEDHQLFVPLVMAIGSFILVVILETLY